ncbi:Nin1 binding protein [Allomyces javanicus]|nr:Nin1 binding protein [Allomyces javanicus]
MTNPPAPNPSHKTRILVLDTAPLIKQIPLYHVAERFITIPDVLNEVRDERAREYLMRLPFRIETRVPSEEALQAVSAFARKTGDFPSLSLVDLRVLALTWMLTKEEDGIDAIRTEPRRPDEQKKKNRRRGKNREMTDEEFEQAVAQQAERESGDVPVPASASTTADAPVDALAAAVADVQLDATPPSATPATAEEEQAGDDFSDLNFKQLPGFVDADSDNEDDDHKGWITPDNVAKAKEITLTGALAVADKQAVPSVSCMSDDFALQNVLLQMNLNLLSLDGMVIKQLKNWLMRCHACFKTTMDMDKRFCPSCGGATLIRTSYSIEDGIMKLHLKRVFQYRTRGTVYSLPKPKGGREGDQLILREDQKEYQVQRKNFEHHKKKQERKGWDEIMLNAAAASAVARPPTIGFGSKNPNVAKRARK